ncbi:uncharacterized protein LOC106054395 isoform X2 [Biomphalaria glabrata]|uniref:Uncharacterized protein LOC106054395 isoform X2 n=1 Tax=Biomphalaria glabrata TaxID=6526 RepID=A0A9W3BHL5_BIOGL|nr:uncharacterized protein LOC106054395 isoform X2 [Biomphalaria glabrata]
MKLFSLTVSVLIVSLSVCGPAAMSGIVLTQKDTMNLLNEIMKQLDQNEERLINITDSTVEALYKQSKTIPVEIQKFFQITQSIKDTFPAQETALNELASHLVTASDSLTQVISQCSNKKIIPNASSRKTKKAIPENSPVVRSFSPTLIKRQTGPQVAGGASNNNVDSVTSVLIRPVEINKTAVDAAVSSVGKSNYFLVGVKDITVNKPDITVNKPDITVNKPDITVNKPDITVNKPDITVNKPDITVNKPDITVNKPDIKLFKLPTLF